MTTATCPRCGAAKHMGRCKAENLAKVGAKPAAKPEPAPAPAKLNGHLEVAAGLGFRASMEDGQLRLEQDRQDGDTIYTHEVWLAPHEARKFVEWVEAQVTT